MADNGMSISFTIRLSPDELANLPHATLTSLARIASEAMLAQAKPVLAELERTRKVHQDEITSLKELGEVLKALAVSNEHASKVLVENQGT